MFYPTASANPASDIRYCFDKKKSVNGDTVTAGVTGVSPRNGWEVNKSAP